MAGIGVKLNQIYQKNTITTDLVGFFYSTVVTIAPLLVVIINLMLMQKVLHFNTVSYINREIFSCTILYVFIFSLLTTSPFNAVLSRYMSDVIFEERYEDVQPCHRVGLLTNLCFSCLFAIPFCFWEHLVGGVPIYYVFTGYCCFVSLVIVFYNMLYLSICKEYRLISLYFLVGMVTAFLLSVFLRYVCGVSITYSMLLSLTVGFFLAAVLEWAKIHQFFPDNSEEYRRVFQYFRQYWQLILINFLYTLGLFIHNFVFWGTDMAMHLVNTFVCNQPYDMATCLAMFTNISASVIFISRVEMYFHKRYRDYADAVFGGRGIDIRNTRQRMFRQLGSELVTLVRLQFIVSVVVYLLFVIFLPRIGYAGMVMRIYPMVAAGYFVLFLMYAEIIFLYYFEDLNGALFTAIGFCVSTLLGSLIAVHLSAIFYGIGVWVGAVIGFTVAYIRLRWLEKHLDEHMFCRGNVMKRAKGIKPEPKVLDPEQRTILRKARKQKKGSQSVLYAGSRCSGKRKAVRQFTGELRDDRGVKKLLFVINTLGCGGAERAMLDLFAVLEPEKYEISLLVLTGQGELRKELPSYVRLLNRDYQSVSVLTKEGRKLLRKRVLRAGIGKGLFLRRAGYLLKNAWQMCRCGKILPDKLCWRLLADGALRVEEEYDLAVAYLEGGATYYVADHVRARKKAAFVHIDYGKAGYTRALDLECYRNFDRIFTVSDEVREHFLEVYPEYEQKVSVFHNLVNRERILKLADQGTGFSDGFQGYRLLTIGRLTRQKRYDIAIQAMALLKEQCTVPVRWYVLGEGDLRDSLEQQIKAAHLEHDFILLGVQTNPYPYCKNCDIYVHATGFEGKSIAIQEAQTLKKPILATDCSGNREQIIDGIDGRLCQLSPEAVSEQLLWMIRHPKECRLYGEAAGKRVLYHTKGLEEFLALLDAPTNEREKNHESFDYYTSV